MPETREALVAALVARREVSSSQAQQDNDIDKESANRYREFMDRMKKAPDSDLQIAVLRA